MLKGGDGRTSEDGALTLTDVCGVMVCYDAPVDNASLRGVDRSDASAFWFYFADEMVASQEANARDSVGGAMAIELLKCRKFGLVEGDNKLSYLSIWNGVMVAVVIGASHTL